MAGRGRRAGYNNYAVQDQLLLCNVVEQMLSLGRNMWEQVAARFNANRTRTSPERDFESLRRKFKSLYSKPKPTGPGEVPLRLKPVVWAKEIQMRIEEAGGVHTCHDGLDGGEDDAAFDVEVDEATAQRTLRERGAGPAPATRAAIGTGIQPRALDDADSDADTVESGDEFDADDVVAAEGGGEEFPATTQARGGDEISQYAQRTTRDVAPTPDTQSVGSILTRSGVIDVNLAADFNLSTEEASEDDGCASNTTPALLQTPTPSAETPASRIDDNSSHSYIRVDSIEASDTNPRQSSQRSVRQDGVTTTPIGRGLELGGDPEPQDARLSRPLPPQTDANREELDTRETDENQNLNVASNRLGGQDLRVFRDNIAVMTQNMLNANAKRSTTEPARTDRSTNGASYAKAKRVRAKQRLDEIQKEIDDIERKQSASGSEFMNMLLLLQKDSDRRAEAEERRRRIEREERLEAEKRERVEREEIRREEARVAEIRRQDELEAARVLREEQRREGTARQTRLDHDREESKRRFEERMALDRAESRQRQEQMMLVLKNVQPK